MAANSIIDDIIDGVLVQGEALPAEADLAEKLGVSRLTLREALRMLQSQNVVGVVPGRRGTVNPISEWSGIEPILRAAIHSENPASASLQLIQVRRMIETGAAELAATRRTNDQLRALSERLDEMRLAHKSGNVDAFVAADIAFHDVIFEASGNVFLGVLLKPLGEFMYERRFETSAVTLVQEHAIAKHAAVLEAVERGDAVNAKLAMDDHMNQTESDLVTYVLSHP
jgi:GntR family transcriptional repressor for pyruvate dehydrogenase complex